uniref:Uncharacterized protein n=1 Tax=Anguilla anguilla TaxID=7936 RepID=A0A0E9PBM4_ANGAN
MRHSFLSPESFNGHFFFKGLWCEICVSLKMVGFWYRDPL